MTNLINMQLARLIGDGKRDPGEITDLILAAGYSCAMTTTGWVKATAEACRTWRSLSLPCGGEPETPQQVMGCFLNEIVDEALCVEGSSAASVAAAVTAAGFTLEVRS